MRIKELIKTWMMLCETKASIIAKLVSEYAIDPKEAERLYRVCLVELGH